MNVHEIEWCHFVAQQQIRIHFPMVRERVICVASIAVKQTIPVNAMKPFVALHSLQVMVRSHHVRKTQPNIFLAESGKFRKHCRV